MKHILLFFTLLTYTARAQNDSLSFKGHIYNNVYNIYIKFNLYDNNIEVPGHELLGPLSGYLGKKNNNFFWLITNGEAKKNNKATLSFINDYGSEDFKAELIRKNDSVYILKHIEGSPLKVPNNGKWQKLPKILRSVTVTKRFLPICTENQRTRFVLFMDFAVLEKRLSSNSLFWI